MGKMPLAAVIAVLLAAPLFAQEEPPEFSSQGFTRLPFNFAPPGARSLAMGATFIGIADDATAAASNPAGLTILTKPELSAHVRYSSFKDTFQEQDLGYSFQSRDLFSDSVWSPSFFSVVVPVKSVTLSAYYQQIANFSGQGGQFEGNDFFGEFTFGEIDMKVEDIAFAASFKAGERFSLGASFGARRLSFQYFTYDSLFGPEFQVELEASADATQTKLYYAIGALVNPNGKVSAGAVYKHGGKFTLPYQAGGYVDFSGDRFDFGFQEDTGTFQIPDSFGGGLAYRPTPSWLLAADVVFVKFSQLGQTDFRLSPLDLIPPRTDLQTVSEYDDVVQIHFGLEYTFATSTPFSIRAGVFNDPDHDTSSEVDTGRTFITVGTGIVLSNRFQIDLAGSFSEEVKEGLASVVVRF